MEAAACVHAARHSAIVDAAIERNRVGVSVEVAGVAKEVPSVFLLVVFHLGFCCPIAVPWRSRCEAIRPTAQLQPSSNCKGDFLPEGRTRE